MSDAGKLHADRVLSSQKSGCVVVWCSTSWHVSAVNIFARRSDESLSIQQYLNSLGGDSCSYYTTIPQTKTEKNVRNHGPRMNYNTGARIRFALAWTTDIWHQNVVHFPRPSHMNPWALVRLNSSTLFNTSSPGMPLMTRGPLCSDVKWDA